MGTGSSIITKLAVTVWDKAFGSLLLGVDYLEVRGGLLDCALWRYLSFVPSFIVQYCEILELKWMSDMSDHMMGWERNRA